MVGAVVVGAVVVGAVVVGAATATSVPNRMSDSTDMERIVLPYVWRCLLMNPTFTLLRESTFPHFKWKYGFPYLTAKQ